MEPQYLVVHKIMAEGEKPCMYTFADKQRLSEYLGSVSSPKEVNRDYDICKLTPIKVNFIPSRFEFSDGEIDSTTSKSTTTEPQMDRW